MLNFSIDKDSNCKKIVERYFEKFFGEINLNGDHRETANKRKDRIVELLGSKFSIIESFGTGSIPKFTALKGHADLDVMVVLHYGKHIKDKKPSEVLQNVRDTLSQYRTNVRKNGQAVTLYYETWPNVDIVPVSRSSDEQGNFYYNVPDINTGKWLISKPKIHASKIEKKSSECGLNFRRIIKMIKCWNFSHINYLQSYHIEVLALNVLDGNLDDTAWHVYQFFDKSRILLESRLWYEGSYVDDYLSFKDRTEILSRFDTAIDKSRSAWYYGHINDYRKAIVVWRQIFGEKFPEYE